MVEDVLVGNDTVLVKRADQSNLEFERIGENCVSGDEDAIETEVVDAITDAGFEFETVYPFEVDLYFHDEAEPSSRRIVAEKMPTQFESDDEIVRTLAGLGYEISMTAKVTGPNSWEVTHIMGHELKEPFNR